MVSVITPAYNSARHISGTIESVLAQTYRDWEMLIVDDGSSDHTLQIVQEYVRQDSRIRLIPLYRHMGAAVSRNTAIKEARGRYIAFLDSDDLWHPQKLEWQLAFMNRYSYAFTFTSYQRFKGKKARPLNVIRAPHQVDYRGYLKNTIIGTLTVIIDRQQTGSFEMPNIRSSHDMALWCDILKRGFKAYGLRETLAYYRIMPGSNTAQKLRAAKDVWKVYRNIEKMPLLPSIRNFLFYAFNATKKRIC
ncbi:MAG: glycosyltransferase family 2 protein [Bacteroidales bacterium]|nr:glycosyltransferase family 2 protein [Bacteroidales bacterium]